MPGVRAIVMMLLVLASGNGVVQSREGIAIRTLSSRADLVSGGDALVAITAPRGALTVTLNGRDVTGRFILDAATGEYRGLVDGLKLGGNRLHAATTSPRAEPRGFGAALVGREVRPREDRARERMIHQRERALGPR
jgi:hypothetical protein